MYLFFFSSLLFFRTALNNSQYTQAGHPNFDLKDSLPLRYDSPMSPYASYYVYVPVSTGSNSIGNNLNLQNPSGDEKGEGRGEERRDERGGHPDENALHDKDCKDENVEKKN